jgi:hypothetical protein
MKLWIDLSTDEERIEFLQNGDAIKTGIIAPAITDDIIELLKFRMQANPVENLVIASEHIEGSSANGAVAEIGKTFIINTDEGKLALSQQDILNTIDADLDMMDDGDLMNWEVMRKDMTEKEINNLPET